MDTSGFGPVLHKMIWTPLLLLGLDKFSQSGHIDGFDCFHHRVQHDISILRLFSCTNFYQTRLYNTNQVPMIIFTM